MACNLLNALKDAKRCKIAMAGTGDRVVFFDKDALLQKITEDPEGKYGSALPEPGVGGIYPPDCAFMALEGLETLAAVDIKTDSGQVTSEKGAENEANSLVGTFVVADNIDNFTQVEHTLRFQNFGAFIPRIGGGYYVIMSPYKKTTLESNFDSGTTYDSDHGFTVTLTAAPAEFGVTTWFPKDSKGNPIDISAWAIKNNTATLESIAAEEKAEHAGG